MEHLLMKGSSELEQSKIQINTIKRDIMSHKIINIRFKKK